MNQDGSVTSPHSSEQPAGQRGRFRTPRPPALAPEPKSSGTPQAPRTRGDKPAVVDHSALSDSPAARELKAARIAATHRTPVAHAAHSAHNAAGAPHAPSSQHAARSDAGEEKAEETSDAQVVRAGGSMAIATLISRITGFLRTVLIGSALGPAVASAFNTAKTLPNLITELVLGAVLTALVVPVLVRAEKEDPDRGEAFIRRLITLTFTLTLGVTLLSVLATPLLIRVNLDPQGFVNVQMATAFGYLVLPQIFFYAMFAVFTAVLNTKAVFKPGAWAPVVNNIVALSVLSIYLWLPQESKLQPTDNVTITNPHVLLLGVGTTLGVIAQAAIMVPYLRKAGINLRPLWGIDSRLKSFGGMAIAIIVYVAISQLGYNLNNRIASQSSAAAPTVYMQAWQLLQVPYGVIGVTLLTAVMPRLSRNAADGDDKAVVRDLTVASKLTMLALIPVIVFMTAFGTLIASALFAYKNFDLETAHVLGWTISFSAFTLIPYALVLLHLRVFYAREEVWTPTFIIAGITTTKLALAYIAPLIATEPRLVVVLLGAANGMGFLAGAIIGDRLLRRSLGDLQFRSVLRTCAWALGASALGAFAAWRVDVVLTRYILPADGAVHPWFLVRTAIGGLLFLLITGLLLSRSRLAEVATIGSALSRLPGVSRLITPARQASGGEPRPLSSSSTDALSAGTDAGSLMMPVLPPLSAGRVRGPRLVAGAPVCGGRYRLLADHGGTPAARAWQARETATGDVVALTIIDPAAATKAATRAAGTAESAATAAGESAQYTDAGSPHGRGSTRPEGSQAGGSQAATAQAKQEILRRLQVLKTITAPGMAPIRGIIDGGSVVLVICDWVQGSALDAVARSGPDPLAAGFAVADLAEAAAAAADAGAPMGLDHRDRIRISTQGCAVMAFPGPLPESSARQDSQGVAATLGLLLRHVPSQGIPKELEREYHQLRHLAGFAEQQLDLRHVAASLRELTTRELRVDEDDTPEPSLQAGFGVEKVRARTLAKAGVVGVLSVVLIAALVVAAMSVLGGNRKDSPISPDSLREGAEAVTEADAADIPLSGAQEWMPLGGKGTPDSPETAPLAVDGDVTTIWQTDSYLAQLGTGPEATKEGIGLLVNLPEGTRLTQVKLLGVRPGTVFQFRTATGTPQVLADTTLVATAVAEGDSVEVDMRRRTSSAGNADEQPAQPSTGAGSSALPERADKLLVWITQLPMPQAATIGEVEASGTWTGQSSGAQ